MDGDPGLIDDGDIGDAGRVATPVGGIRPGKAITLAGPVDDG